MEWTNPARVASHRRQRPRRQGRQLDGRGRRAERAAPARLEQEFGRPGHGGRRPGLSGEGRFEQGQRRDLTLPDGKKLFIGSTGTGAPGDGATRGRSEDARSRSQSLAVDRWSSRLRRRSSRRRPGADRPRTRPSRENWTPPRTPDGQPDLQGIWTNYTGTPFEVPDKSDTPELLCRRSGWHGPRHRPCCLPERHHRSPADERTSLVVDPPSGRVPIMPWAEERRNYKLAHIQDDWVNFTRRGSGASRVACRAGSSRPATARGTRSCRVPATWRSSTR